MKTHEYEILKSRRVAGYGAVEPGEVRPLPETVGDQLCKQGIARRQIHRKSAPKGPEGVE